ncbi:lysophosphatidylcholine acyltransferase 2 [Sarcoptes scabiei]|nr:lysophosphatidylcholine acyltransferase 2 [Sarcoptes scabiei]
MAEIILHSLANDDVDLDDVGQKEDRREEKSLNLEQNDHLEAKRSTTKPSKQMESIHNEKSLGKIKKSKSKSIPLESTKFSPKSFVSNTEHPIGLSIQSERTKPIMASKCLFQALKQTEPIDHSIETIDDRIGKVLERPKESIKILAKDYDNSIRNDVIIEKRNIDNNRDEQIESLQIRFDSQSSKSSSIVSSDEEHSERDFENQIKSTPKFIISPKQSSRSESSKLSSFSKSNDIVQLNTDDRFRKKISRSSKSIAKQIVSVPKSKIISKKLEMKEEHIDKNFGIEEQDLNSKIKSGKSLEKHDEHSKDRDDGETVLGDRMDRSNRIEIEDDCLKTSPFPIRSPSPSTSTSSSNRIKSIVENRFDDESAKILGDTMMNKSMGRVSSNSSSKTTTSELKNFDSKNSSPILNHRLPLIIDDNLSKTSFADPIQNLISKEKRKLSIKKQSIKTEAKKFEEENDSKSMLPSPSPSSLLSSTIMAILNRENNEKNSPETEKTTSEMNQSERRIVPDESKMDLTKSFANDSDPNQLSSPLLIEKEVEGKILSRKNRSGRGESEMDFRELYDRNANEELQKALKREIQQLEKRFTDFYNDQNKFLTASDKIIDLEYRTLPIIIINNENDVDDYRSALIGLEQLKQRQNQHLIRLKQLKEMVNAERTNQSSQQDENKAVDGGQQRKRSQRSEIFDTTKLNSKVPTNDEISFDRDRSKSIVNNQSIKIQSTDPKRQQQQQQSSSNLMAMISTNSINLQLVLILFSSRFQHLILLAFLR